MTFEIFPWQMAEWQTFLARKEKNRLPHALLVTGAVGLGKKQFALAMAHSLLCQHSKKIPCGECQACHLMAADSHPDLIVVAPEQEGGGIKIDQIRSLVDAVYETPLLGIARVVIIHPANSMNIAAQNALLKTLEEPPPHTFIFLTSFQSLQLKPTLTSRCQTIAFQKPAREIAMQWLQSRLSSDIDLSLLLDRVNNAPLMALDFIEKGLFSLQQNFYHELEQLALQKSDPLSCALAWHDKEIISLLSFFIDWLQERLRYRIIKQVPSEDLFDYIDHVKKIYAYLLHGCRLNTQLVLEELFIRYTDLIHRGVLSYAAC